MINKQTCSKLPTLPTLFVTEATSMVLKMPSPTNSAVSTDLRLILSIFVARDVYPHLTKSVKKNCDQNVQNKRGGVQRLFKQLSEKLVADGIPYHDNDYGSDVALGSRKMALIMTMRVR